MSVIALVAPMAFAARHQQPLGIDIAASSAGRIAAGSGP